MWPAGGPGPCALTCALRLRSLHVRGLGGDPGVPDPSLPRLVETWAYFDGPPAEAPGSEPRHPAPFGRLLPAGMRLGRFSWAAASEHSELEVWPGPGPTATTPPRLPAGLARPGTSGSSPRMSAGLARPSTPTSPALSGGSADAYGGAPRDLTSLDSALRALSARLRLPPALAWPAERPRTGAAACDSAHDTASSSGPSPCRGTSRAGRGAACWPSAAARPGSRGVPFPTAGTQWEGVEATQNPPRAHQAR